MARNNLGRFQTGNKGGPGRPVGSRNRLAEDFLADLCVDWRKYGAGVITKVRSKNPTAYTIDPRQSSPASSLRRAGSRSHRRNTEADA